MLNFQIMIKSILLTIIKIFYDKNADLYSDLQVIAVITCIIFPLCLFKRMDSFRFFGVLSFLAIIYVVIILVA